MTTATAKTSWNSPAFDPGRLADALECTEQAIGLLISLLASSGSLTGTQKVSLAVASALHRQAGVELPVAAAIAHGSRRICESVLSTLDFYPPVVGEGATTERDPFMFFAPHASEAVAVPAIDEFIDVMDGSRICWRRPQRDAYRLACELQRLTEAVRTDDTPALQEEYLELLAGLRGPASQVSEWIGTIRDGTFRPAPDRFAEPSPAMRQGPGIESDASWSVGAYGTCVSVKISLAARGFKRRMLGLDVTDPFAGRPSAHRDNQGVPLR